MKAEEFIDRLSARGRVLMLGGLAVIAHGLARSTRDVDVWLEPFGSVADWSRFLGEILAECPGTFPHDLRRQQSVALEEIEESVSRDGVIRVGGLDRPLDVFRVPHNLAAEEFEGVWRRAPLVLKTVRVPDEIDLLLTKEETSRPQDAADIAFLEEKIRLRLSGMLRGCTIEEAQAVFKRYADHVTCESALSNPDLRVQDLAARTLREFADAGDPFALRILRQRNLSLSSSSKP